MRTLYLVTAFVVVLAVSILGFRGRTFTKPPMDVFPEWLFPGMKQQPKLVQQTASAFFADGRSDRVAPPNTVASSYGPAGQPLKDDDFLYRGKLADGSFARGFPPALKVDMKLLERGSDRFTIYCSPCHGAVGDGKGSRRSTGWGRSRPTTTTGSARWPRARSSTRSPMARADEPLRGQARPRRTAGRSSPT